MTLDDACALASKLGRLFGPRQLFVASAIDQRVELLADGAHGGVTSLERSAPTPEQVVASDRVDGLTSLCEPLADVIAIDELEVCMFAEGLEPTLE